MVIRTQINKSNTIIKNSYDNYGLYPISMLNYGNIVSRIILQFDKTHITNVCNNYYGNIDNIKHTLKMTNCGNVDLKKLGVKIPSNDINGEKERAVSFSIIALKLPNDKEYAQWDEGIGFDDSSDFWLVGRSNTSNEGSNWFNYKSGSKWLKTGNNDIGNGVYTTEYITKEYEKFINSKNTSTEYNGIIISEQHFDHGNEDLEIDITSYINDEEYNNGILLMFVPDLETLENNTTQYVGFFNEKTNTAFIPCIETRINDTIQDNRFNFSNNNQNRLYLYFNDGENYIDLDEEPICLINDRYYQSQQQFKGVYYVTVNSEDSKEYPENYIMNDIWSVKYNNKEFNIEQEFVTHCDKKNFSPLKNNFYNFTPSLSGINDGQILNKKEKHIVNIKFRKPYSTEFRFLNNTYYRIYIKDGNSEITIIDWDYIENTGDNNYFIIDTTTLAPNTYYVDIKSEQGLSTKIFKESLYFKINNDKTRLTH